MTRKSFPKIGILIQSNSLLDKNDRVGPKPTDRYTSLEADTAT